MRAKLLKACHEPGLEAPEALPFRRLRRIQSEPFRAEQLGDETSPPALCSETRKQSNALILS